MSLASIDGKLFAFYVLETFWIISSSIDPKDAGIPPLDAPRYDESNELCFTILRSLDGELIRFNGLKKSLPGDFCHPTVPIA